MTSTVSATTLPATVRNTSVPTASSIFYFGNSRSNNRSQTRLIYQLDDTLRTHSARVIQIRPATDLPNADKKIFGDAQDNDAVVTTDATIFYPQGGGQPFDVGTITSTDGGITFRVSAVRHSVANPGVVLHLGCFACSKDGVSPGAFAPGQAIVQSIDNDRRETNSRLHTGGHVVASAVRRQLMAHDSTLLEQGASHAPGASYVVFQGTINGEHKAAIQAQVDAFVDARLSVMTHWWTPGELRQKCATVPPDVIMPGHDAGEQLLRAIDIEGAGAYPCGGTHVKHLGQVGRIMIKKISRAKGQSRVSYIIDYPGISRMHND
jgi:Ser-tRNA(Ala) deacylase AlaX